MSTMLITFTILSYSSSAQSYYLHIDALAVPLAI
uniref:Uncharacterized protein n=1 Tax=Heterorhabditis bacteriophora TaxID=37862 RepID=A0A1I7WRZ4_HETBA